MDQQLSRGNFSWIKNTERLWNDFLRNRLKNKAPQTAQKDILALEKFLSFLLVSDMFRYKDEQEKEIKKVLMKLPQWRHSLRGEQNLKEEEKFEIDRERLPTKEDIITLFTHNNRWVTPVAHQIH